MKRRQATQAHATDAGGFDAIPIRYLGLFESGPTSTPFRPKTADELAEEIAVAILVESHAKGSTEPDATN